MLIYSMSVSRTASSPTARAASSGRSQRRAVPLHAGSPVGCDVRYRIVVGAAVLPPVTKHVELHLVETRTFGARVVYERYVRA